MTLSKKYDYNKYINYIAVLFAFVAPISRAGIVLFSMLLILLWILEGGFKEKYIKMKNNNVIVFIIAFVAFYFISLLWSSDIAYGIKYAKKFWYFLPIFVIFTSVKKEYIKYMISAFLLSIFISEIISYGIFFEWWQFKNKLPSDPTPFMNRIQYSMFLAFAALLLLNRSFTQEIKIYKLGYFIYFLSVVVNLFMNGGRTGQLAFIISIFIVVFLNVKNKIIATLLIIGLSTPILVGAYSISPNFQKRVDLAFFQFNNMIETKEYCSSVGLRIGMLEIGSEVIIDNPIIGVGASDAMTTMHSYIDESHPNKICAKNMPNYHNDFLQIMVQLGLIGGFIYILMFYNIVKIKIKEKEYTNLPIIFVSVYIISSMFENMIHQQFSMILFSLFVGIFLALNRIENENKVH